MERKKFEQIMEHVIRCVEDAGYSAEEQITAYVLTGDTNYITRSGNAREWIQKLDRKRIARYLEYLSN